jgi:hypothetical protein
MGQLRDMPNGELDVSRQSNWLRRTRTSRPGESVTCRRRQSRPFRFASSPQDWPILLAPFRCRRAERHSLCAGAHTVGAGAKVRPSFASLNTTTWRRRGRDLFVAATTTTRSGRLHKIIIGQFSSSPAVCCGRGPAAATRVTGRLSRPPWPRLHAAASEPSFH